MSHLDSVNRKISKVSAISAAPPDGSDLSFAHSILCQVGLPRSKFIGDQFYRRVGKAWIRVEAGALDLGNNEPTMQCVPYGVLPRLILGWLSTYAIRNKTREIPLFGSAAEFMERVLQRSASGGQTGTYRSLRQQMHALAACRMQIGFKGQTFNGQAVEQFETWLPSRDGQRALWPAVLYLSPTFYAELIEHGVPLDNRAISLLKGSSLALDLYFWLGYRLPKIETGLPLTWRNLRDQFGQEYQGKNAAKDFKRAFKHTLNTVKLAYPQSSVEVTEGGVIMLKSDPPVPFKLS